jgi:hypothetical protein
VADILASVLSIQGKTLVIYHVTYKIILQPFNTQPVKANLIILHETCHLITTMHYLFSNMSCNNMYE